MVGVCPWELDQIKQQEEKGASYHWATNCLYSVSNCQDLAIRSDLIYTTLIQSVGNRHYGEDQIASTPKARLHKQCDRQIAIHWSVSNKRALEAAAHALEIHHPFLADFKQEADQLIKRIPNLKQVHLRYTSNCDKTIMTDWSLPRWNGMGHNSKLLLHLVPKHNRKNWRIVISFYVSYFYVRQKGRTSRKYDHQYWVNL